MNSNLVAWLLAAAGAVWFGMLAFRTGRNWLSSALTGGFFALITTTFVFGLGNAMCIPLSDRARSTDHMVWTLISAGLVAVVAGVFTAIVWRKPLVPPGVAPTVTSSPPAKDKSS